MSISLTIIFFSHKLNGKILNNIPSYTELSEYTEKIESDEKKIQFYIVDSNIEPPTNNTNKNITYLKNPIYEWDGKYDPNVYKENMDVRHPIEGIEGTVIVFCVSDINLDIYSIMEEFPTQRYSDCFYFKWESKLLDKCINEWVSSSTSSTVGTLMIPNSPRLKSKNKILYLKQQYQLYSGDKLPDEIEENDLKSIYSHMILLCDYIRAYLRFNFMKKYNIAKMRALTDNEYKRELPFFTDTQIDDMVKNSYYFQVEDTILRGFLLAHKVCVADGKVSPLNVEIDLQTILFNHGQFRRELLTSMMKIVANFSVNNDILTEDDFSLNETEEEEEEEEEKTQPKEEKIKKRNNVMISKVKSIKKIEEVKITKQSLPHSEYFTKALWDKVEKRINLKLI